LTPTPELYQALVNLRGNPDFQTVIAWLDDGLRSARDTCEKAPADLTLYRSQGEAKTCRAIVEANQRAPEMLEKLKSK
jgi:hypothetical protein